MTSPAQNVDTTDDGQGGTGPGASAPASNTDTTQTQGGSTGDTVTPGPAHTPFDSQTGYGDADGYRTGDPDNSTPQGQIGDTTNGGIGETVQQPYRAPSEAPGATNFDTQGQGGVLNVNPGSPDAAVVGNASGVNPNAVEPGFTSPANYASSLATTGYGDGGPSHVPAGSGIAGAPTGVTATVIPNRRAVNVAWVAPANAAAAGVLGYVVETTNGGTNYAGKDDTHIEMEEGLEGGRTYSFTVYARTANGNGYRSAAASATIPTGDIVADTDRPEGI